MARKSWFSLLRRFLNIAETQPKPHKERRRRWAFGRLKIQSLPSLSRERSVSETEAEQEQSKHAVTVAIATAAAAAEQDFAEVVRLNGIPQTLHQSEEETQEFAAIKIQASEKEFQDVSATKIQAVFRGYLARKALRALRGLVRLQAIIRGRAVRRQAITTLKCLQSVVNIQSQVCARRIQMVEGTWDLHENKQLQDFKDKVVKIDSNSQKRWDDSILSKDEANALFFSKRVAVVKRERINEYLLNHRRSAESEQSRVNGRRRYWLEQWVDTQLSKNSDTVFPSNARIRKEYGVGGGQLKLRNSHMEGLDSPVTAPRRSFHHKKQRSVGDDNGFGFASSPVVPTYMAATESAKAKARSTSSPRQRPASLDAYSETNSPYKHKLSPISSFNSEVTSSSRICNLSGFQQRSPCLKGIPGPVKSSRSLKDLSFDSECSLPNLVRNGALFR